MPIFNGSQRIRELYVGGQRIRSAHMWNGAAWQRVHIWPVASPSRVNKSGDQSFTASTSTTPIGWTLAAGYKGAATSNGLLVVGSGTVDISAQVTAATSTLSKRLQILRNGVQVGDEGAVGGSTPVIAASANGVAVSDGDVISLSVRTTSGGSTYTISGGPDTFIQITAA